MIFENEASIKRSVFENIESWQPTSLSTLEHLTDWRFCWSWSHTLGQADPGFEFCTSPLRAACRAQHIDLNNSTEFRVELRLSRQSVLVYVIDEHISDCQPSSFSASVTRVLNSSLDSPLYSATVEHPELRSLHFREPPNEKSESRCLPGPESSESVHLPSPCNRYSSPRSQTMRHRRSSP